MTKNQAKKMQEIVHLTDESVSELEQTEKTQDQSNFDNQTETAVESQRVFFNKAKYYYFEDNSFE
jgi:hypothetical protein